MKSEKNCYKFGLALSALCVLGFATTWPADAGTPRYTIIDLGVVSNLPNAGGQRYSSASGINNSGQVVGDGSSGVVLRGFRTAPESPINPATDDLGTLGGSSPRGPLTIANGINKSGQVVGASFTSPLPGVPDQEDAFRTAPNSPINPATDDLGVLGSYKVPNLNYVNAGSFAYSINNSGQVVGYSTTNSGETHGFRTAPESPINPATDDLGTLGGTSSEALGINQSGQVVGDSTTANGETHAFRTARNRAINPATDDLGTLGGTSSYAIAINQLGRVVGDSTTANGETHAFRTARNRAINPATDDLGTLGGTYSRALGINKLGQVVGDSTIASGETHAFLYDVKGHLIDLNSLISPNSRSDFSVLTQATAINDRGQIVGYGTIPNFSGDYHAFLATPVNTNEVTPQSENSSD